MTDAQPWVRSDVQAFLDMVKAMGRPEICDLSPAEAREAYLMTRNFADLPPVELAEIRDLSCPGPAGAIPLRFYDARHEREAGPLVVFTHGGGFLMGDLETHHHICTEVAATLDLPVVAVDYRLAPEHPFPAAPVDCEAAARWLAGSPAELGRQITGLIPMGDSAGGNLAIVTSQALLLEPAAVPVVMQVPIYPVCDDPGQHPSATDFAEGFVLTKRVTDHFDRAYAGDPTDRRVFPVLGRIAGLPPTVLATAGLDPLRDSGRTFAAELVRAGVSTDFIEFPGTVHGFIQMRRAIPSAQTDFLAILAAAKSMLERIA